MGIRGLERYLERNSPAACYEVNVVALIHNYRKENNRIPIIVVDGMSVMRFIYKFKDLSWICGGQLKEYEQTLKDFIYAFRNEGAELVFFFDGPHVSSKRETWIRRRLETLENVYGLLDDLSNGLELSSLENNQFSLLPSNLRLVTVCVAKLCGCKVYSSVRECDLEIAEYAFQNNCMAILGQDTDFVIFKSVKYYLSIKNFDFRYMTTLNYDRDELASSIGLYSTELPLLASLLGNDIISSEELKAFHQELMSKTRSTEPINPNWINFKVLILEVATFIKNHVQHIKNSRQALETIAEKVFKDKEKWETLNQSIESYNYLAEINKSLGPPSSVDENWNKILRKAYELHSISFLSSTVYGIIAQKTYSCATCLEDYRLDDLPPSQIVLKPLREKLYGLLLCEDPEDRVVEEWVMCGPQSLDQAVYIKPKKPSAIHSGLLALWRGNTVAQWSIIGDIFEIDSLKLRSLPTYLIVPALTLRYLYSRITFLSWELVAVVSSAVLLRYYEAQELSRLPLKETIIDTRPIRLHTLISRSYSTIILILNSIGDPVPCRMVSPSNYQDGKLFHFKYFQASQNIDLFNLCERKGAALDTYNSMIEFITENNSPPT